MRSSIPDHRLDKTIWPCSPSNTGSPKKLQTVSVLSQSSRFFSLQNKTTKSPATSSHSHRVATESVEEFTTLWRGTETKSKLTTHTIRAQTHWNGSWRLMRSAVASWSCTFLHFYTFTPWSHWDGLCRVTQTAVAPWSCNSLLDTEQKMIVFVMGLRAEHHPHPKPASPPRPVPLQSRHSVVLDRVALVSPSLTERPQPLVHWSPRGLQSHHLWKCEPALWTRAQTF